MSIARSTFGTPTTFTITLASLASDANLSTGRSGAAVDLTAISPVPVDVLVGGKISLSSASTTTVAAGKIEVWAAGSVDGTVYSGGLSTADAGATFAGSEKFNLKLLTAIAVTTTPVPVTTGQPYDFGPFSLAQAFGGVLPLEFNLFVVQNTAAALNGTSSNHAITYTPVNYASS